MKIFTVTAVTLALSAAIGTAAASPRGYSYEGYNGYTQNTYSHDWNSRHHRNNNGLIVGALLGYAIAASTHHGNSYGYRDPGYGNSGYYGNGYYNGDGYYNGPVYSNSGYGNSYDAYAGYGQSGYYGNSGYYGQESRYRRGRDCHSGGERYRSSDYDRERNRDDGDGDDYQY